MLLVSACRLGSLTSTPIPPTATLVSPSTGAPLATSIDTATPTQPAQSPRPEWSDSLLASLPPGSYIGILQPLDPSDLYGPNVLSLLSRDGVTLGVLATAPIDQALLSPQADHIAYTRMGTGGLCIRTISSGHTVCSLGEDFVRYPTWSRDGSFILAMVGDRVAAIDPTTAELLASATCHLMLGLDEADCFNPTLSADGKWIAVAYAEANNAPAQPSPTGIYVFTLDCLGPSPCSQPPRKIPKFYSDDFSWAPQFMHLAIGASSIFDVAAWALVRELPLSSYIRRSVLWSPDGGYLAFTNDLSVFVADSATGDVTEIYFAPAGLSLEFWVDVNSTDPSP